MAYRPGFAFVWCFMLILLCVNTANHGMNNQHVARLENELFIGDFNQIQV